MPEAEISKSATCYRVTEIGSAQEKIHCDVDRSVKTEDHIMKVEYDKRGRSNEKKRSQWEEENIVIGD
jgi:hypothetical protein